MKYLLLTVSLFAVVFTACKSTEEKTNDWVLKDEGVWLVVQSTYEYEAVTQSVVRDSGTSLDNGVFEFYEGSDGNYELILPFLDGVLNSEMIWNVDQDTVRGTDTDKPADSSGGTANMTFTGYEISKNQMRIKMLYLYSNPDVTETINLELNLDRRRN